MSQRDHKLADFAFLWANAQVVKKIGLQAGIHIDQPIGIWNYIRIADDIVGQMPAGRILDWGCGYGQMTYLLRQRGLNVTPFDLGDPRHKQLPAIPICRDLAAINTTHPTNLPFRTGVFDAVLSCGVLEHVDEYSQPGNELRSLHEIARVLRPGGLFLIYQLPQQYAWQEALIRRLRLGYAHPRRYTEAEIVAMLLEHGYTIQRIRRANLIPKNLTGMPAYIRSAYSRLSKPLITLDGWVSNMPGMKHVAGVLEIAARREGLLGVE